MNQFVTKALKNVYIIPGFLNMQGVVDGEKSLDIKPLTNSIVTFSSQFDKLNEEQCNNVVAGIAKIYDLQAASNGTLGALKAKIHSFIESKVMDIAKRSNPFFSAPTGDIRDVYTVQDVEEIFKISKVFYNDSIKSIIDANKEKLIKEYLAKEVIDGVYIFTRSGVQFLLDNSGKTPVPVVSATVEKPKPKPVVVTEAPAAEDDGDEFINMPIPDHLIFDLIESNIPKAYWKTVNIEEPMELNMHNYNTLCHTSKDYHMAFLNILWFFRPYNSLPYFFANNLAGINVWGAQTRSFVIFTAEGLRRAIRSYYIKFVRQSMEFPMADFINAIKNDFGYIQGKHTLTYKGDQLNDVMVFDKRAIVRYIMKRGLHKELPFGGTMKRGMDAFLDKNTRRYNRELTMPGYIDLNDSDCYKNVPSNTIMIMSNYTYPIHIKYGYDEEYSTDSAPVLKRYLDPNRMKEDDVSPIAVPAIAPVKGTYEEVAFNTTKPIFLSDVVEWVVANSATDSEEVKKIGEVYKAITKYASSAVAGKYANTKVLTEAIRNFDGVKNNVIFTPKKKDPINKN